MTVQLARSLVFPSRLTAVLGVVCVCCTLFACRSRHRQLTPPPDCKTPEVLSCLSKYAFDELDESALERLLEEGIHECFARDPGRLREQASCLPVELGKDRESGHPVIASYFCSDICPDRGGIMLKLRAKLGRKACCDLGGTPFIDGASNTYRGCMPDSGNEALRRAACG